MDVADLNPAQLGDSYAGDVRHLRHDVVPAGHHRLPGLRQISPPAAEELLHRLSRRRDPQPEVTAVTRPVEWVDRRLDRGAEPAEDLAGVPLLEEREVAVDPVDLGSDRRVPALAGPGEVAVQLTRGEPPGNHTVEVADLDHRLDDPVQSRRREAGGIPCPLVLGKRLDEERLLVLGGETGLAPTLQRDDVSQPSVQGHWSGVVRHPSTGRERQGASLGIRHGHLDYMRNSWNPGVVSRIPRSQLQDRNTSLTC
ncbi:hypothetical protein SCALM49S_10332 [Streptomyces californicus]